MRRRAPPVSHARELPARQPRVPEPRMRLRRKPADPERRPALDPRALAVVVLMVVALVGVLAYVVG